VSSGAGESAPDPGRDRTGTGQGGEERAPYRSGSGQAAVSTGEARRFSDGYGRLLVHAATVREEGPPVTEEVLQWIWREQRFAGADLRTVEGHRIEVISPGWWNRSEGPDFKQAEIRFNGALHSGDVEIHFKPGAWNSHKHQTDPRYDQVMLHVVLEASPSDPPVLTAAGRRLPTLALAPYLAEPLEDLAEAFEGLAYTPALATIPGKCGAATALGGEAPLLRFLALAGEWRMLEKARRFRERVRRTGLEQSLYESLFTACGFGPYKENFERLAQALPYARAVQLAHRDPHLLEAALMHLAGLLPADGPALADNRHYGKIAGLRDRELPGLGVVGLEWRAVGVRPNNRPERRLGGFCVLMGRLAKRGIAQTLEDIWRLDCTEFERRAAFEQLFPKAFGFWATHCTWSGKTMARPSSPLGAGRVRSIIGNVMVPVALAQAREAGDRCRESRVQAFFAALPGEASNKIQRIMVPRLGLEPSPGLMTFQLQQGLIQMHRDWCEPNPACRNCTVFTAIRGELTGS